MSYLCTFGGNFERGVNFPGVTKGIDYSATVNGRLVAESRVSTCLRFVSGKRKKEIPREQQTRPKEVYRPKESVDRRPRSLCEQCARARAYHARSNVCMSCTHVNVFLKQRTVISVSLFLSVSATQSLYFSFFHNLRRTIFLSDSSFVAPSIL